MEIRLSTGAIHKISHVLYSLGITKKLISVGFLADRGYRNLWDQLIEILVMDYTNFRVIHLWTIVKFLHLKFTTYTMRIPTKLLYGIEGWVIITFKV